MPALTTVATGLAGAVGCDFQVAHNKLIFVEFGGKLSSVGLPPGPPAYTVLGTGYTNPEDVKLSADGLHAYVVERSGDLVKVTLSSANRASATVVASGMSQPQQMFLDEANNTAYVVEFGAPGRLWKINLLSGVKTAVTTGLTNAVGLILSSDLQFAYVTEQVAAPIGGRITRIQMSSAARTPIVHGLVTPFFLAWTDAGESALYCPQRDPANTLLRVDVTLHTTSVVAAAGLPFRPTSVALVGAGKLAICCDSTIVELMLLGITPGGPLLRGIGFIPFDRIAQTGAQTGLANTSVDPAYFYQVVNTPFGGTLPVMIDHAAASAAGAAFYQVKMDGVAHTDVWSDYKFVGGGNVLQTITPVTVGGAAGCYPVRPSAEVLQWLNPTLGDLLSTTGLSDGLHKLTIELVNAGGVSITASPVLKLMINNQSASASLGLPMLGAAVADGCGVIHYGVATNPTPLTINFTASHPAGFANYSFSVVRGVTPVTLPTPPPASGPVSVASTIHSPVATLLGGCPTAGYAVELYVAVTINNGWGYQSQYDASSLLAFVLTP